jgi:hypothetical protein
MEAAHESQSLPVRRTPLVRAVLVALPLAAGLALRLWMLKILFQVGGDALIYGDLAKNLLLHGSYALTVANGDMYSTLIRLPGYPLFLALCFWIFGVGNYLAAILVQIVLDLAACLLLAGFVRRISPPAYKSAAALAVLWLAALCPFTASYAVASLAEGLTLFFLSLALWAMARFHDRAGWSSALWFTFAVTSAALLRPEGGLAALAFAPALLIGLRPQNKSNRDPGGLPRKKLIRITLVCMLLALAPFAVWTWRNWHVFHVFQPLAPRLATDPDEPSQNGWEHWMGTWCLDFTSTSEIYWHVPGDVLDVSKLPPRAFDSPAQYAETAALASDYNANGKRLAPEIDARFDHLAARRNAAHPLRSYLWLPLGRVVDMWLRPRLENLNVDLDWWNYVHHPAETRFGWAYAGLNVLYLLLAAAGLCLRPRFWLALLAYILLRSALLLDISAPETRYTLECFPMLFVLGGIAVGAGWKWRAWKQRA